MWTRRDFLKSTAMGVGVLTVAKAGVLVTPGVARAAANSPTLAKWVQPIRSLTALGDPDGIPVATGVPDPVFPGTTYYQMGAGEFLDQLHPALGPTRLWGYFDTTNPIQRHLGGVVLAQRDVPVRIRFTNVLPTPHIIPVDVTLDGADQAQNRIAVHNHGGLVPWISDGGPFAWWTPSGQSGPSFLNGPGGIFDNIPGQPLLPGQADNYYPNSQSARLLWYHDHALGITRLSAYAGLASGYLIQDSVEAAYVAAGKIPGLGSTLPLIFQDKIFVDPATTPVTDPTWSTVARPDVQSLGSLWYEHVSDSDDPAVPNPSVVPEFFGDTMLCNGLVYPLLTVEAKRYRFLILNACNARFLNVNLFQANPLNPDGIDLGGQTLFPLNPPGPTMIQIGSEGGFLVTEVTHVSPKPFNPTTRTGNLLLGNAERADIIVDFTGLAGNDYIMYNDAPAPFPNGDAEADYFLGNPDNPIQPLPGTGPDTRQLLRIRVVAAVTPDPQPPGPILNPALVDPPLLAPVTRTVAPIRALVPPTNTPVRNLTLNESVDQFGRLIQLLGTTAPNAVGDGFGRAFLDPPTEVVNSNTVEVWRIFNTSADTHPIHFHLVNVQVLSRQPFRIVNGVFQLTDGARGPQPNELGWKETVQMHPGEMTAVIASFEPPSGPPELPFTVPTSPRATAGPPFGMGLPVLPNVTYHEYVWHCHILEHEEHDMMRPLVVRKGTVVTGFSGKATGVGRQSTSISIVGTFALYGKVDLAAVPATLTISSLLNDGQGDVLGLPLILLGNTRNNPNTAYFKTAVGAVPSATVSIGSAGRGVFRFRIDVRGAASTPSGQCPNVTLLTAFEIQDGVNPPIAVSNQQRWRCFGVGDQYLSP